MHGACTFGGLAAAWLLQATTRWGLTALSKKAETPDLPRIDWELWREEHAPQAAPPDKWVVGLPGDRRRRRFHLLLPTPSGRQVGFAKFTVNPTSEFVVGVRKQLDVGSPQTFWTPRLLAHGTVGGWHFTVDSPMPIGFHKPARVDSLQRHMILEEIRELLRPGLGAEVVHGDFGPWNVRAVSGHPVIVLDWEEATVGPAGVDELWYALNAELIRNRGATGRRVMTQLDQRTRGSVAGAAEFLVSQLEREEPAEIEETLPLSLAGKDRVANQKRILWELLAK